MRSARAPSGARGAKRSRSSEAHGGAVTTGPRHRGRAKESASSSRPARRGRGLPLSRNKKDHVVVEMLDKSDPSSDNTLECEDISVTDALGGVRVDVSQNADNSKDGTSEGEDVSDGVENEEEGVQGDEEDVEGDEEDADGDEEDVDGEEEAEIDDDHDENVDDQEDEEEPAEDDAENEEDEEHDTEETDGLEARLQNGNTVMVNVIVDEQAFEVDDDDVQKTEDPSQSYEPRFNSPSEAVKHRDASKLATNGRGQRKAPLTGPSGKPLTRLGRDGNLFYCHVCHDFGDVVCCDGCPHVYHRTCIPKEHPSRQALDSDQDPWYCPDCMAKDKVLSGKDTPEISGSATQHRRAVGSQRRAAKRKCGECQQSGGDLLMVPCEGCGVYLHHPPCQSEPVDDEERSLSSPLCSNCRAEEVVSQEEDELVRQKAEDDIGEDAPDTDSEPSQLSHGDTHRRSRARSMDSTSINMDDSLEENDDSNEDDETGEHNVHVAPPNKIGSKRKRSKRPSERSNKKRRGRPPLSKEEKDRKQAEREAMSSSKTLKKKKNKKVTDPNTLDPNGSPSSEPEDVPVPQRVSVPHGLVKATPAFFFFLADTRLKIERVLARKHKYFNRLPKGMERNELIAREGALWWVKLRPSDHKRYLTMSMRDFEERVIEWKEEKSIQEMVISRDVEDAMGDGGDVEDVVVNGDDAPIVPSPADDMLTFRQHQRLYLATSVGSKPFVPEPGKSNNRVLLELLQDMRFHPLPMFSVTRPEVEPGQLEYSKMTIPYFDVHGPVATSVGDECLGCTRGWNHFCPVLKRRFPAVEHRARLQPPLSSLMATRIGVGLRPRAPTTDDDQDQSHDPSRDAPLFSVRDTAETKEAKLLPPIPSFTLTQPSARADDVVHFVEEVLAMKVQEPPRPSLPSLVLETSKKSMLSRGALPIRGRKKREDGIEEGPTIENGELGRDVVNKCGRCRTIIQTDTGCIQCRRAQLVINMSKRQPVANPAAHVARNSKNEGKAVPGFLKVQTTMLGRLTVKDSNFDKQPPGDKAISNAMMGLRWSPNAVVPPQKILVPASRRSSCFGDDTGRSSQSSPSSDRETDGHSTKDFGNVGTIESDDEGSISMNKLGTANTASIEVTAELMPSSESIEVKDMTGTASTSRRHRSARLIAATANNSTAEKPGIPDRQEMAEVHQDEANELHRRCLSVATSGILLAMMRRDPLWLFAEPVPGNVVGYSVVVSNPIDFGKIRSKVLNNKYGTLGAFITDARLLCTNALAFNPPGSIYWKTAKELHEVLEVMQKRASDWMSAIKNAHASSFAWRGLVSGKRRLGGSKNDEQDGVESGDDSEEDPFRELRKTWPDAVEILEGGNWLRREIGADFMRTKENENAYYGSLAVRRAALAAEASLAEYPDTGGVYNAVVRRSHTEDEALRRAIDKRVADVTDPVELKDMPTWREEAIIRILRRVQSRRVEGCIASENGCARCDGMRIEQEAKMAMTAEAVRWGRNKKKGELDTLPRVAHSRLPLTTGLASANTRERIEKHKAEAQSEEDMLDSISDVAVSVRGSRIHGWGLFADQPFRKGDVVAEYVGEYITNAVADAREKMYQEQRIQDYQFRVDESIVIDATLKGGHGRYINHNCNPNCVARIGDGKEPNRHLKRVVITAQRDIKAREEITYDYQFPLELDLDSRIPCNCGSLLCRGFMNWDLPEKGSKTRVLRTQKRGGNMRDRIRRLGRPLKK